MLFLLEIASKRIAEIDGIKKQIGEKLKVKIDPG
jgi:hypothetical protein